MQLITYVTFAGNCEEALNFYKEALGGEVIQISHMGDGQMEVPENLKDKVMHARMKIGESVLYMSDTFDPTSVKQGNNVSLSLEIEDTTKLEKLFNELSAGGTVKMPLEDTFWGARFGMLTDKFGIHWMMNCQLKKEPSLN
jgi:PhnB protein